MNKSIFDRDPGSPIGSATLLVSALALVAGMAMPGTVFAASLSIKLDDTLGNVVEIADNGAGDINPTEGAVTWSGALGSWIVNVTTGIGTAITPDKIDLNSVNVSGAAGTLVISMSETDLQVGPNLPITGVSSAIGGVANGNISAQSFINTDNTLFSTSGPGATQIIDFGPVSEAFAFAGEIVLNAPAGPSSLTNVVTLDHAGGGLPSSFDFETTVIGTPVPLPAALWLMGSALGLLGLMRRRYRA